MAGARDHKLHELAEVVSVAADFPLTEDELNVLERLSNFVVFAGRYPISLKPDGMKPVQGLGGETQVPSFFTPADFQITKRLLNGFSRELNPFLPPRKPKAQIRRLPFLVRCATSRRSSGSSRPWAADG